LQEFHRSSGLPTWMSVTTAPKGSYREQDIIQFLKTHLEEMTEGRQWRILLADDFSAHKTKNVFNLCWSRGYVLLILGGGSTPVMQTCDTDLNQHVRREYGSQESRCLLEKMRDGQAVPKLSDEECMMMMHNVLLDPKLHVLASEGYQKTGQSIDLHGSQDNLIVREAASYWWEETSRGHPSMRPFIDQELAAVADEMDAGGITWCQNDVQRLISAYPSHKKVDRILERLGEDFYLDALQSIGDEDDTAVAEEGQEADSSSSDESEQDEPAGHVDAAVAGDELAKLPELAVPVELDEVESEIIETVPLSASHADAVERMQFTVIGLEASLENLLRIGHLNGVSAIEHQLKREKRKIREFTAESPAVAEAFLHQRTAEDREFIKRKRLAAEHNQRLCVIRKGNAEHDAAVADTAKLKKSLQDMEHIRASRFAIKSYTPDSLGDGSEKAGGPKCRNRRWEVLDRVARLGAGLSAGQSNDWQWFKETWDHEMVNAHGAKWGGVFSEWIQAVLNDERSNAFSFFVYNETCRVFHTTTALHVPGV
jgi:hypothetical protein